MDVLLSDEHEATHDLVVSSDGAYSGLHDRLFGPERVARIAGPGPVTVQCTAAPELDGFRLHRGQSTGSAAYGPACLLTFRSTEIRKETR